MAEKALCGFVSAVLSQSESTKDRNDGGVSDLKNGENARIFLISNKALNSKPKATNNRKHISYSDTYNHKGN